MDSLEAKLPKVYESEILAFSAEQNNKKLTAQSNKKVDRKIGGEEGEGRRRACRFAGNITPWQ
jgi:hypothetical protein